MFFFFFQAKDGIRDIGVTGVQTFALPISGGEVEDGEMRGAGGAEHHGIVAVRPRQHRLQTAIRTQPVPERGVRAAEARLRSEERRGGEEGRSRWSPYH